MYIKFSDPLNAHARTLRLWERPMVRLESWRARLVHQYQHRKASALLGQLDERLLHDIGEGEPALPLDTAKGRGDAATQDLRKQLLRAI